MLRELDRLYTDFLTNGFGPVREEWQRRCNANGRNLSVTDSGTSCINGLFTGIDSDGALLLQSDDGILHRITSGDVRII
jgi:BirA family biotin operon repressor/biotin-[acetyl-CoA-carboxylase] ligase